LLEDLLAVPEWLVEKGDRAVVAANVEDVEDLD
jgi:hypothetical protein